MPLPEERCTPVVSFVCSVVNMGLGAACRGRSRTLAARRGESSQRRAALQAARARRASAADERHGFAGSARAADRPGPATQVPGGSSTCRGACPSRRSFSATR
ncbi:MAG: hypothetical protein O9972_44770 [Burkholderiales bacterium]|nr:hypothetical protein [Burkholderiales bacterium]